MKRIVGAPDMRRAFADDGGVAILELALIAPLLILLTLGIVEVGLYARVGIEVGNAARAGVQYGAQTTATAQDTAGITSAAQNDAHEIASLSVTPSYYCTCDAVPGTHYASCASVPACATGDHQDEYVQVTATKTFAPLIQIAGLPSSLTVTKTATQQVSP